jgi:hypothetical protein
MFVDLAVGEYDDSAWNGIATKPVGAEDGEDDGKCVAPSGKAVGREVGAGVGT